jgi:hypothetical protein
MSKKKKQPAKELPEAVLLVDNQATTKEQIMSNFVSVNEKSNVRYVKAAELADIDVTGTYEGAEEGKFGLNHKIKTQDGQLLVVNGFGALNSQLSKVSEGDLIKIVYQGKTTIKDGPMKGKQAHSVDVKKAV